MLNISNNKLNQRVSLDRFTSAQKVFHQRHYKHFNRFLLAFALFGFIILFLPWTQNINGRGYLTTLKPDQRPQTIQSPIPGRIEKWYVQEGDYIKKGDTDSILKYGNLYQKELGNWDKEEQEKKYHYAKAHYFMGVGNVFNGLLEKATEWHIKGIQAAEKGNLQEYEFKNKVGLSKTYLLKDDPDKAIALLEETLPKFSTQFTAVTNNALILLGNAHLKKSEFVKAKTYYDQASKIATDFNDLEMELTVSLEQAKLAEAREQFGKAFQGYEKVRNRALKEGYTAIYFEGSLLLAKRYFEEEMYETANIALSFAYINAVDRENLQFQKVRIIIKLL